MAEDLLKDNKKLVEKFGAKPLSSLESIPDHYGFTKGLIYSHRDFDTFLDALNTGKKCAIVSGFNASGTIHLGHKAVFDTNLYFQREYDIPVYIPISDDESYVAQKVESQQEARGYAMALAKQLLAYGFDPTRTHIIIDQEYTNIYNLAFRLSRRVTMSEVKAAYGYRNEENIGLHFYPAVQAAHVTFPQIHAGIKHVLVPIGPDEDAHLRIARDAASREGLEKPAVVHSRFLPGLDGEKMSKSKGNAIFFEEEPAKIKKKIMSAFSGGRASAEEHRKKGGDPEVDIACQYLSYFYLTEEQRNRLFEQYRTGKLLSGDVKQQLAEKILADIEAFQKNLNCINENDLQRAMLKNP